MRFGASGFYFISLYRSQHNFISFYRSQHNSGRLERESVA